MRRPWERSFHAVFFGGTGGENATQGKAFCHGSGDARVARGVPSGYVGRRGRRRSRGRNRRRGGRALRVETAGEVPVSAILGKKFPAHVLRRLRVEKADITQPRLADEGRASELHIAALARHDRRGKQRAQGFAGLRFVKAGQCAGGFGAVQARPPGFGPRAFARLSCAPRLHLPHPRPSAASVARETASFSAMRACRRS